MGDRAVQAVQAEDSSVQPTSNRSVLRAKVLARRVSVKWEEHADIWEATVGAWSARVAQTDAGAWEWRAFSTSVGESTRAVGGRGWTSREQAQEDAESTLGALV